MDLAVKYIVPLGMTPWLVITAIPRGKEFVCRTGMVKTSATFIAKGPMIPKLVTPATQMETKYVYKTGMARLVTVRQGMIRPWATCVILPLAKESV